MHGPHNSPEAATQVATMRLRIRLAQGPAEKTKLEVPNGASLATLRAALAAALPSLSSDGWNLSLDKKVGCVLLSLFGAVLVCLLPDCCCHALW